MTEKKYVFVWIGLLALTALTVIASELDLGAASVVVALIVASGKSTLVLLYFMHLRHEKSMLLKMLIPIALIVLTIFIGLTYTDILFR
jgi:cytochrome c oxidase subunit 4